MDIKKLAGFGKDFEIFSKMVCKKYGLVMSQPHIEMGIDENKFEWINLMVQFYPKKSMEIDIKDLVSKNKQ